MRRLPVYVLIDTSGSMHGEPIEAVRKGLDNLASQLRKNPYSLETAWLSILTFADEAKVGVELTELTMFQPPSIRAGGTTSLGEGLKLLCHRISREVKKTTSTQKGDWKPLVFLMTDGAPTDNWRAGLKAIRESNVGVIVACAAGEIADTKVLSEITPNVLRLNSADEKSISDFFKWVSSSVQVSSTKIESSGNESNDLGDLPPPPQGIDLIKH